MATELVLRQEGPAPKGAPLTSSEVDNNFLLLQQKSEDAKKAADDALAVAVALGG